MERILVRRITKTEVEWRFEVQVGDAHNHTAHVVTLGQGYWQKFASRYSRPEDLIAASFHFLLGREPKESILFQFDLSLISKYFPEYEEEMKKENGS
jgi:hypothetical protein